ncbi:MAG: anion permease [Marinilabiliaceae bacterium]
MFFSMASAALLIPILAAIATGMGDVLTAFGGAETMLIGVALCASLAMALPISTPPNALAYATGVIKQSDMAKSGIIIGVFGMLIGYVLLFLSVKIGVL